MITIATFLILHQANVSLEVRGERLSVAAPKIAKALGMNNLIVLAPLANEVAAIRVVDADPDTLKKNIEHAFHGTFIKKDGGWTLEQTIEQKAKERTLHFESLTEAHQDFIIAAKKVLANAKPFNQTEATKILDHREKMMKDDEEFNEKSMIESRQMQMMTPSGRFALEIISKLKPEHWRQVDVDGRRATYSLKPTNVQFPLPINVGDSIANFITRQRLYSQIGLPRFKQVEEEYEDDSSDMKVFTMEDFFTLNVIVQESNVQVISYDAKGEIQLRENITVDMVAPDETDADAIEEKYSKLGPKLSPLAEEYITQIENYYGGMEEYEANEQGSYEEKPISPQLRAVLMDPVRIDPLSIAVPEVLFGSNPKRNIVANLNPYLVTYRNLSADFLKESAYWVADHDLVGDWLTIGLPDAFPLRKQFIDRTRMAQVFRLFTSGSYPSIERQADYAKELTMEDEEQNLCYLNLMLLLQGGTVEGPAYAPFINLYGALSSQERVSASKQPLALGGLSKPFLWTLADCVIYQKHDGMYPRPKLDWNGQPGTSPTAEQIAKLQRISQMYQSGFFTEPTYRHPNGLTTDMTLSISETQNFLISIKLRSPVNGRSEQTMSPTSLGFNLFRKDFPSRYAAAVKAVANYDLDNIKVVTYRQVQLVISPNAEWEYTLSQHEPQVPGTKTFTAKSLPPEVQSQVDQGIRLAKQAHESSDGSNGNRIPPPPLQKR
ncbi:MAG TPA: hypothetical protein VK171_05180 [Fimbriimonas sp.]|nr:hypothetical protein [Fimbriimonas sp.]